MTDVADTSSLWHDRNYVLYRVSRAICNLGSQISGIAGPLLVLSMSDGGVVRAGAVGSAALAVRMAAQLPGGKLADRFDQRLLMVVLDVVRVIAVGSIPLAAALGHLTFPLVLVVVVIGSAASTVFGSTAMVFVRLVVPPGQFARAMSQSQASFGVAALAGPMLGGALYAVDPMLPFIVDSGSYLVSAVLLLAVSARFHQPTDDEPAAVQQVDRRATAGLRWLLGQRGIMRIVLLCSVLNLVGAAMGVAAVIVMSERGTPSGVIGIVVTGGGAGTIVGSLIARKAVALGPIWIFVSSGLLWAGALATLTVSSSPWVIGGVVTFLAVLGPSSGVMLFKILRDEAPKNLYGRVISAQQLVGTSLATAGPLLAGVLVAAFGGRLVWLVLIMGPTLASRRPVDPPTPDQTMAGALRA